MSIDRSYTSRLVKRAMVFFLGIFLLFIILLGIGWHVLRSDHPYVIERLQSTALEKWNANLHLDGYQLEFIEPFPLINLQIKGLSYGAADHPDDPVVKINQVTSEFNPWNLITGKFHAHPFHFDSVWIHLYKDSLQNSNLSFDKDKELREKRNYLDLEIDELPFININYLDFNQENDFKNTQQWLKLSQTSIIPKRMPSGIWSANLKSDSYFETVLLKSKDGPFLKKTHGKLNLNLAIQDQGKSILMDSSSLIVGKDEYLLSGQFVFADINILKLQIKHEGVLLKDALPLLSDKINNDLRYIKIDQPIQATFNLSKYLTPDRAGAIRIDFATADANIIVKGAETTETLLSGYYINDVGNDEIGGPRTAELLIDTLDGDILGILPIRLKGILTNLLDNPQIIAQAILDIDMPRLNPLLSAKDKITFSDGNAYVDFDYQGHLLNVLSSPFDEQGIKLSGDAIFTHVTLETGSSIAPSPSLTGSLSFDENETRLEDLLLDWMGSQVTLSGSLANLPEFLFYDDEALKSKLNLHFDKLDLNKFKKPSQPKISDQKRKSLDATQVETMTRKLASNINGQIDLEIEKLIYDTLYLTDLHTHLSLYTPRLAEYMDSSILNIQELTANFMGHTPMQFELSFSRDSLTNVVLGLDMPKAAQTVNLFLPADTEITNGNLDIHLDAQAPLRALLNNKNLIKDLQLDGMLRLNQLELELPTVELPVKKVSGELILDKEQLDLKKIGFIYQGSPFELNGIIRNYSTYPDNAVEKVNIDVSLKGDYINLRTNETTTTSDNQRKDPNPAELFRALDTVYFHTTGKIDLYLDSILTNEYKFQPFLLDAQLLPDLESADYRLVVDSFNLGLGEKNYIKGSMTVVDPELPYMDADLLARMKFSRVGDFLSSDYIEFQDGFFKLDLKYRSPLYDTISAENYLLKAKIDGDAKIVDGRIFYNYRDFDFDDINGDFKFDQRALNISKLDLKINENRLSAKGECTDFFPFFIEPDQKALILLDLRSPHFDFGKFKAPEGLNTDTLIVTNDLVSLPAPDSLLTVSDTIEQNIISQTAGFIDLLLSNGSLEMKTAVDKLVYNKFSAQAINGNMFLKSDTVLLRNMGMEVAQGNLTMNGLIFETVEHKPRMEIDLNLDGSNISEIFRQFENFGLEAINNKQLKGFASADLVFKAQADATYTIIRETMQGNLRFKIAGGKLEDIPALKELKGFLYKKRRLDEIAIDTLEIITSLRGPKLYVEKFKLHSSPFDFDVEGIYDLNNQDATSILLSVPLGNLNRRYIPPKDLKSESYIRKGPRIYIESRYKNDKLKFFWKPFIFLKKIKYEKPKNTIPEMDKESIK